MSTDRVRYAVLPAQTYGETIDAVTLMAKLASAGAVISKPAHDTFWRGCSGYFKDPDGRMGNYLEPAMAGLNSELKYLIELV